MKRNLNPLYLKEDITRLRGKDESIGNFDFMSPAASSALGAVASGSALADGNVAGGAIGLGVSGAGMAGAWGRNQRQKQIMKNVFKAFPNAAAMCQFLDSNKLERKGLTSQASDDEYYDWVRYNIALKGHFWRNLCQFLFGGGLIGGGVALAKSSDGDLTAPTILGKRLKSTLS